VDDGFFTVMPRYRSQDIIKILKRKLADTKNYHLQLQQMFEDAKVED
jgi:hypothetical protein